MSGGAIDTTTTRRAESRPPGHLSRAALWQYEYARRFEEATDAVEQWRVVRDAAAELARREGRSSARMSEPADWREPPPGRPRSSTQRDERKLRDLLAAKAEEQSGLPFATLLETVGPGRPAHPALVSTVLAERAAGATLAALERALPEVCKSTLIRWGK